MHPRQHLIVAALKTMPDIPEPDVVAVLRYVLAAEPQVLAEFLRTERSRSASGELEKDAASAKEMLMAQLLRVPRNDVFLTQQLRELTAPEVEVCQIALMHLKRIHTHTHTHALISFFSSLSWATSRRTLTRT